MSTPSPFDEDQAGRLSEALRAAGTLAAGRVADVAVGTSRMTAISIIERLRLRYAGGDGPATVIRKRPRGDLAPELAQILGKEADFDARAAPHTPAGRLAQYYGVVLDGERRSLLLEDLTDSHALVSEWPVPPTLEQCEDIVDTYAAFHAHWWDDPRLGDSIGTWLDIAGVFERHLTEFPKRLAAFADRLGDRLAPERLQLYERLLESAPRLLARYRSHRGLTLVHGDSHVWNALYPRDPLTDTVRLIDWDGWRVDTASDDLSYMMALRWYPDRRRRFERRLLERYHDTLTAHGVAGYPLAALLDDYRLSVLWQITTPVWQASLGLSAAIWWSHLERIMLAIDDLDCRALLD